MRKYAIILLLLGCALLQAVSFGQNKVNATQQDWSVLKTTHFDIYFSKGEDQFGRTVALMAEDIYYYIKADLKYPILSRIPIIFYSSKSQFQTTNIIYPLLSEGIGGFTESLRNRVVVPFDGNYSELEELLAHELTHAYVNALDRRITDAFQSLRATSFPFWFSEGLPEFLSIGGEDDYNNMFILDMVVNDNLPKLDYIDGYLAYRLGESFLTYIASVYGRNKVNEYFYTLRTISNLEDATKKVFGMKFEELESRWRYQLKRDFFPTVNTHNVPQEAYEPRTENKKDGSYFNFSPRFSPDGSRYVYFSDVGARYSIWLAGTQGLAKPRKIFTGETTAKAEEFHYFRSNLSWFPDGRQIAFSAKTADGDRIHIQDVDLSRITRTIKLDTLSSIFELDVSPDGRSIVMSAQQGMQSDLFLYNLENDTLSRLTNDSFSDIQPRFSRDGSTVVFASKRMANEDQVRYGFFVNYTNDIFSYNLQSGEILQHTNEPFNCTQPMYSGDGTKLLFLSQRNKIANLEILDLSTNSRAPLTNTLAGVYNGDVSLDDNYLILSNYFNGGWNIYFASSPFDSLKYEPYPAPVPYSMEQDLLDNIDYTRLDYYGVRKRTAAVKPQAPRTADIRRPVFSGFEPVIPDSEMISIDYSWDERPESPSEKPPVINKYRPKFGLDTLWGGIAYSSSSGAIGNLELGLSDLMGDHAIGISLGVSDKLEETNFLFTYLYLKPRLDWGLGVYNFYDELYYREFVNDSFVGYSRQKIRQTGLYGMVRYPFSRFFRLEFDNMLYEYRNQLDYLPSANINSGSWINDLDHIQGYSYAPGMNLVYDNALFGSTGPMVGWRGLYRIQKGFASDKQDYLTNYLDLRSYNLFSRRYSLALRLNAGISTGNSPDRFSLGGYYGVRALDTNLSGEKKVLGTVELRFPFLDYFALAFPLPLGLSNIRGSAFVDAGAVWDQNSHFQGMQDGKLQDIKLGYGFGPRINLGYFVLNMDVSWLTDFTNISKPQVYFSLTNDF